MGRLWKIMGILRVHYGSPQLWVITGCNYGYFLVWLRVTQRVIMGGYEKPYVFFPELRVKTLFITGFLRPSTGDYGLRRIMGRKLT